MTTRARPRRRSATRWTQATQVDRLMSIYSPASQVFQLNRDGVLDNPHPHLLAVLRQARALSELTRGAFDITVQPLWQAFSDAADEAALPSRAAAPGGQIARRLAAALISTPTG